MKIKKILFAALSPIFAFSAAQAADYYYIATFYDIQGTVTMGSAAAWSLSPRLCGVRPTTTRCPG